MVSIFVDTGAWDAIEDAADSHHAEALRFKEELADQNARLYVTNFVLDECYTLLLSNVGYERAVAFKRSIDVMRRAGILLSVHITDEMEQAAWEVFEQFNKDKDWSFTDCTSKVVMERLGIREAFAFDHHFDQMGFVRRP